jgi:hypothetical protein
MLHTHTHTHTHNFYFNVKTMPFLHFEAQGFCTYTKRNLEINNYNFSCKRQNFSCNKHMQLQTL